MRKQIINGGGDGFVEAIFMHNRDKFDVKPNKSSCIAVSSEDNKIIEGKQDNENELFKGEASGQILFSTEVNSKMLSDNVVKNKLLQVFSTVRNRMFAKRLINKIIGKHNSYDWEIEKRLGTYTGKDGKTYNENLIVINCGGITKDPLFKVAEELMDVFNQASALVKYNDQICILRESHN